METKPLTMTSHSYKGKQLESTNILQAVKEYKKGIKNGDSTCMVLVGKIFKKEYCNYDKMMEYAQMALKKNDHNKGLALSMIAESLIFNQKFEQVVETYYQGIALGCIFCLRGLACYYQNVENDLEKGIYHHKIAEEKGNRGSSMDLCRIYYKQKQYSDALSQIDKAKSMLPQNSEKYHEKLDKLKIKCIEKNLVQTIISSGF